VNIPAFSVKRAVTVTMLVLIIVVLGLISYTRLGFDLLPDITYPVVSVVIRYPGASPEDIEKLVTKPVEETIVTIKNVKKVNSTSFEGFAILQVEFEWGTNIDLASQDIRDNIDLMKSFLLPEDVQKPMVLKFDSSMMPLLVYGVTGGRDRTLISLKNVTKEMIKDRLEQIDGVASAMLWGGEEREIFIEVDRKKLDVYGITMEEIISRLRAENYNLPGGNLQENHKEYILRTVGEFKDIKEIETMPIGFRANTPIYLKDVVKIKDTVKETKSIAKTNESDSVMFFVTKESGANTVIVARKVKKELRLIEKDLPEDIKLHMVFDMSRFISRVIDATASNAVLGSVFAIIILYFFLRNWRPTITIGINIPLSILATFIPLYFFGQSLNFITMIGIALGVWMLVDNSIVVIENIYRHFTEGEDRIQASINGASEVGMAITTSTITTLIVFLPLIFAKGLTGKLFEGLGIAVSSSLLGSLFISLTIVPVITSKFLSRNTGRSSNKERKVIEPIKNIYRTTLEVVLKNRAKTLLVVFGALILSIVAAILFAGREFFPEVDNSMAMVKLKMPVGTNLEETYRVARIIEGLLLRGEKGVETVLTSVGVAEGQETDAAMGTGPSGPNEAQLFIRLFEKKHRKKGTKEIIANVKNQMPRFEGVKIEFTDMGRTMMTGGGSQEKPIDIKLFGKDLKMLELLAEKAENTIRHIDGISDVSLSLEKGKPEIVIRINREKTSRLGLTVYQVAQEIQTAIKGRVATRAHWEGEEIDIRVQFSLKDRSSIADLKKMSIPVRSDMGHRGSYVQLDEVAEISRETGPVKLTRENQKKVISISANVIGRNIGKVTSDVRREINKMTFPEGYFVKYGGEAEQMTETFRDLGLILLLAIVLIYMVMAAQFESFVHPFVIMFTVPFSIIGALLGLLIFGKAISLPAGMGMLIMSGVIVNNGIVLVDYTNQLRHSGKEKYQAIIEAGLTRLRPVLMTALTTILAMLPMAISTQEGAEVRSVVALVMIGGLIVGTLLTLIVLPVVYILTDDFSSNLTSKMTVLIRKEK